MTKTKKIQEQEVAGSGSETNSSSNTSTKTIDTSRWTNAYVQTIPKDASKTEAYGILTESLSSNGSIYILSPDSSKKDSQVHTYTKGYYGWNVVNKWLVSGDTGYTGYNPSSTGNIYAGDTYYRIDIPTYEDGVGVCLGDGWSNVSTITIEKTTWTRGAEATLDSYASENGSIFIYAGTNPRPEQVIVSTRGQKQIWDESRWVMADSTGRNLYDSAYGNGGVIYEGDVYYKIDLF